MLFYEQEKLQTLAANQFSKLGEYLRTWHQCELGETGVNREAREIYPCLRVSSLRCVPEFLTSLNLRSLFWREEKHTQSKNRKSSMPSIDF